MQSTVLRHGTRLTRSTLLASAISKTRIKFLKNCSKPTKSSKSWETSVWRSFTLANGNSKCFSLRHRVDFDRPHHDLRCCIHVTRYEAELNSQGLAILKDRAWTRIWTRWRSRMRPLTSLATEILPPKWQCLQQQKVDWNAQDGIKKEPSRAVASKDFATCQLAPSKLLTAKS